MIFITWFLAGKTAALCFNITPRGRFLRSRLARLVIVLSPLFFSTWVAITRIEDYVGCSLNRLFARLITFQSAIIEKM